MISSEFYQEEIQFKSIIDGINTTTELGRFFFNIMGSLAQMERELIAGRKRTLTNSKLEAARKLLDDGIPRRYVAEIMKISVATLYRHYVFITPF